jgi:hypothetical protein
MNQEQIDSLKPIVEKYGKIEGWYLNRVGAGPESYSMRIKSPRLPYPVTVSEPFTEEEMLIMESEAFASHRHADAVSRSLSAVMEKIIKDLGVIYRIQLQGKEVVIPEELTLHDVKINLQENKQ